MRCTSLLCRISGSLAVAGVLALTPVLRAQQSIQIFLSAVDGEGKPVSDLRAEEVTILVDGGVCKQTKFEEINWPVKLSLLIDNGPVHTDALRQLREALRLFLAELPTDMMRMPSVWPLAAAADNAFSTKAQSISPCFGSRSFQRQR